ncbi:MAG: Fic family protein [Bacteroidia bacterium]
MLDYIGIHPFCSSKEIDDGLGNVAGYATIKRQINQLVQKKLVVAIGKGKATRYQLSTVFELIRPIDVREYFQKEIDERIIKDQFNHTLIKDILKNAEVFTAEEMERLTNLQHKYSENAARLSVQEYKNELERLAIDLSWKSSQIEGNTYSLLETEQLLKEKHTAAGKTKDEATMLLNHKAAIDFIVVHPGYVNPLTVSRIEDIHSLLVKELNIDRNTRKRRVGISGTNYKPLDNEFQIKEALADFCDLVNAEKNVFVKALFALVLLSYIQPFADGNKRTARILSNALLMDHHYCPISFRTVGSMQYKEALLIFYEQNNISAFKKLFIEQFEFAVKDYF